MVAEPPAGANLRIGNCGAGTGSGVGEIRQQGQQRKIENLLLPRIGGDQLCEVRSSSSRFPSPTSLQLPGIRRVEDVLPVHTMTMAAITTAFSATDGGGGGAGTARRGDGAVAKAVSERKDT